MPIIKLKNGKFVEVTTEQQNKLAAMFATDDLKQVRVGGEVFNVSDIEELNHEKQLTMIEKLKAQGLNTDWYYRTK